MHQHVRLIASHYAPPTYTTVCSIKLAPQSSLVAYTLPLILSHNSYTHKPEKLFTWIEFILITILQIFVVAMDKRQKTVSGFQRLKSQQPASFGLTVPTRGEMQDKGGSVGQRNDVTGSSQVFTLAVQRCDDTAVQVFTYNALTKNKIRVVSSESQELMKLPWAKASSATRIPPDWSSGKHSLRYVG